MPSINVSDSSLEIIEKYADKLGLEKKEGADRLIGIAKSRVNALWNYADKNRKGEPRGPRKPKVEKKTAKKAAKGPIARKAKKATKAKAPKAHVEPVEEAGTATAVAG